MQFTKGASIYNSKGKIPDFAEDYYQKASLIAAGALLAVIIATVVFFIMLLATYFFETDIKQYKADLVNLESRLQQRPQLVSRGEDTQGDEVSVDMELFIAEQERKVRELEPLIGKRITVLEALTVIEKSIPDRIFLNSLEYSSRTNQFVAIVLTRETNDVEEMVAKIEALNVFSAVAIVKKERVRSQDLYYEVEMKI